MELHILLEEKVLQKEVVSHIREFALLSVKALGEKTLRYDIYKI